MKIEIKKKFFVEGGNDLEAVYEALRSPQFSNAVEAFLANALPGKFIVKGGTTQATDLTAVEESRARRERGEPSKQILRAREKERLAAVYADSLVKKGGGS